MMESSTAEATGGLTVDQAAKAFEAMLGADEATPDAETGAEEAQTEAEAEGDEPETETEDGSEGEGQPDDQPQQPQSFRVKVDGEEVEVTLDELTKGYSRTQDYTRKTQVIAEKAKALDAQMAELAPLRDQYKAVLDAYEKQLAAPPHSDEVLEYLRANDATQYAAAVADNQRHREGLDKIRAEKARLDAERQAEVQGARAKALAEAEAGLRTDIPEWADPQKLTEGLKDCFDYASKVLGLEPGDVLSGDARQIRLTLRTLRDAAAYRAIQSKKPVVQQRVAAVKTAAPGTPQAQASKVTELTRSKQRLAKTGRVDDAAAVFMHLIPD
jgi:hypothetical protein